MRSKLIAEYIKPLVINEIRQSNPNISPLLSILKAVLSLLPSKIF